MRECHAVIIGGGLAGLAAGCYARANGMRATIVEHNVALGGVCTAWTRGPYTIDGCIHWLTGGPFDRLYEELGILPAIERRVLDEWLTYRSARTGATIRFTRDLDRLLRDLRALAPADADELARVIGGARKVADLGPPIDHPRELAGMRDHLAQLWEMRREATTMLHFRGSLGSWSRDRLHTPELRQLFEAILPAEVPAVFLCMVLGYLERGHLSRPVGGSARFRDALIASYQAAGGEIRLSATVDEIAVENNRAVGVRLVDGTLISADLVISTSSLPETALRMLGGRYGAGAINDRLATWKLIGPIVLASFGVAAPLADQPGLAIIDHVTPLDIGGATNDHLYVRVCNDDPTLAPPGHTVVQALLDTTYDHWTTLDSRYAAEKDAAAEAALAALEPHIPGLRAAVEVTDVATPLTFWKRARSWHGAFEGWMPNRESLFAHVERTLGALRGLYLAGQWVEPGGGVPTAVLSGRHAIQLACAELGQQFQRPTPRALRPTG